VRKYDIRTVLTYLFIRSSYTRTFTVSSFLYFGHFTDCKTPWTSDQLVTRPLPKYKTTQTQNKHIHIPNIHALCGIRTHDPGFPESEDSACIRPLGHRDRQNCIKVIKSGDECIFTVILQIILARDLRGQVARSCNETVIYEI
jgi:hypothetical protein